MRASFPVLLLALFAMTASAADSAAATYRYPDQPGLDTLAKGDPERRLLNDGKDDSAVWGAWDVKPFVVDWQFAKPVRIRSLRVAIQHPVDPETDGTHPRAVHLTVAGQDQRFVEDEAITVAIPFERGPRQVITLVLPGEGLVAKGLRTRFEGSNRQIVIGEVTFAAEAVGEADLSAALAAAAAKRPAPLKEVTFLPPAPQAGVKPPASSIFGAAGHMLHTDHFYPGRFSPYWRLEYTLPFVQRLGIGSMREPIYQAYFFSDDPSADAARAANRKLVEDYIAAYDRAGIKVVVCAITANSGEGGTPGATTLKAFCHWLADMAKRYPCIEAIEIGNEPNLPPFWNHSAQDYVNTAREIAKLVREVKPDLPIVVGSFSGMGGVWMRPDMLKEAGSSEKDQSIHWAKTCFAAGLLEFADGVSTHPYSESSTQPEGGVFLQPRKDPSGYEKELVDFWNLVQRYNTTKRPLKLYFTELGYEVVQGRTYEWQADYLSRLMLILFNTRVSGAVPIERVHWYDLKEDDAIVGASGWGLVSLNATHVTPAFVAYQQIARTFGNTADFSVVDVAPVFSNWPEVVKRFAWRRASDGALIVAFWRMEQAQGRPVDFDSNVTLTMPAGFVPKSVEVMDLHANQAVPLGFAVEGKALRTAVRITDRAAWLVIKP